jgi:hypothetical protein
VQRAGIAIQLGRQGEAHAARGTQIRHLLCAQPGSLAPLEAGIGSCGVSPAGMAPTTMAVARMLSGSWCNEGEQRGKEGGREACLAGTDGGPIPWLNQAS